MRWPQMEPGTQRTVEMWRDIKNYQALLTDTYGRCVVCGCEDCIFERPCRYEQSGGILCMACGCARTRQSYLETGSPVTEPADNMGPVPPVVAARTGNYTKHGEGDEVLPQAGATQEGKQKRKGDGLPFLANEQLNRTPKEARILAVKADPQNKFGASVLIKIALDGQKYLWNVRLTNPCYATLTEKLGHDETDWVDKRFLIGLVQDETTEKWWPTVSFSKKGA